MTTTPYYEYDIGILCMVEVKEVKVVEFDRAWGKTEHGLAAYIIQLILFTLGQTVYLGSAGMCDALAVSVIGY